MPGGFFSGGAYFREAYIRGGALLLEAYLPGFFRRACFRVFFLPGVIFARGFFLGLLSKVFYIESSKIYPEYVSWVFTLHSSARAPLGWPTRTHPLRNFAQHFSHLIVDDAVISSYSRSFDL